MSDVAADKKKANKILDNLYCMLYSAYKLAGFLEPVCQDMATQGAKHIYDRDLDDILAWTRIGELSKEESYEAGRHSLLADELIKTATQTGSAAGKKFVDACGLGISSFEQTRAFKILRPRSS